jgi:lipid II isoglutaminyl synthase (glutamine-hydrolysing)
MMSSHSPLKVKFRFNIRLSLGLLLGQSGYVACRWLGKGAGSNLPGVLALKIQPKTLWLLAQQLDGPVVAITGTNGKTTTSGLLAQLLCDLDKPCINNHLGANMLAGVTAALVTQSQWFSGKLTPKTTKHTKVKQPLNGVLEVDEASLRRVAKVVRLDHVVVTNLFRDQLDRYGELDTTAKLILEGVDLTTAKSLVLNADDPMVTAMGSHGQQVLYFGVESISPCEPASNKPPTTTDLSPLTLVSFPKEVTQCPSCGTRLQYTQTWFGHLGHYHCDECGFFRPKPTVWASQCVPSPTGTIFTLHVTNEPDCVVVLPLPGLFNVYNLLAAITAGVAMGHSVLTVLEQTLAHYHSVFGRAERKIVDGKPVVIMLIKNPTGASEVLRLVASDPKARLLIALNDNDADGRDVSWIWDAMFELLAPISSVQTEDKQPLPNIIVSGDRAEDMALRLKYAGLPDSCLWPEPTLHLALQQALTLTQPDETLYILPTYTALLALQSIL